MAAGLIKDLEEQIARLKADLDNHKTQTAKNLKIQQADIDTKATKKELEDLEARLMEKLQELMNNLANMFADKDQMRKKFLALEKNVSAFLLNVVFIDQKSVWFTDGFAKRQQTRWRRWRYVY